MTGPPMKNLSLWNLEVPVCHRRPDRSFFYRGRQFPVCARCTGLALAFFSLPLFAFHVLQFGFLTCLLLQAPALVDGATQALGWRQSTNWLRLITGLLGGIGQMGWVALCGDWILRVTGLLDLAMR
jgi:uncharacterized membrane protein